MPGRPLVSSEDVLAARAAGRLVVPAGAIVTDAARELAASLGVKLAAGVPAERRRLVLANWKMNLPPEGLDAYARALAAAATDDDPGLVVLPPALALADLARHLAGSPVEIGLQDVHPQPHGAFTGETSAAHGAALGARWALAGHSERRRLAGESGALVAAKLAAARLAGLRPVLCVGETERERDAGRTLAVLRTQLAEGLACLESLAGTGLAVAYEPVWAIGSGRRPAPDEIGRAHRWLRAALGERWGAAAGATALLYGGSVTAEAAPAIMAAGDVDGFLVGGASLAAAELMAIARACRPA